MNITKTPEELKAELVIELLALSIAIRECRKAKVDYEKGAKVWIAATIFMVLTGAMYLYKLSL